MQYYINAIESRKTMVEISLDKFNTLSKQPEFDTTGVRLRAEVLKSSAPEVKAWLANKGNINKLV
jgi:hypothetical protein